LLRGARDDERRIVNGRMQSIGEAMRLEQEHLGALASEGFDLAPVRFRQADASACAKVFTSFYSAPAGNMVQAKASAA
jgi:hypothetical protein